MSATVLITGANRGIGLELTRQYLAEGAQVFAACRQPEQATELNRLAESASGRLHVHPLDVSDPDNIQGLRKAISAPIDVLFNNAGIYGQQPSEFGATDVDAWTQAMRINVFAPMKMMEAFADLVATSEQKKIINMSSKMGSMADNGSGGSYVYRSSKAALNCISVSAAIDLKSKGITVVAMHPGWVKTDMGGANALIDTQTCVTGIRKVVAGLTPDQAGQFIAYSGDKIPW